MSAVGAMAQMPRYQSHKRVWALKIAAVEGHRISFADPGFAPIDCPPEMFARGSPQPGSYLVEYEGDGYRAFSPGPAFEDGYRPCNGLTFGDALDALKAGKRVARAGWNGKDLWLSLIPAGNAIFRKGGAHLDMQDCIGMKTASPRGEMQPGWLASQADMLAEDWRVIEE